MVPLAPWLAKYIPEAEKIKMSCEIIHGCKIVDAAGKVLTEIPKGQGDAYTHAEITLPDLRPAPSEDQLPSRLPFFSYFSSDYLLPWWTIPVYRQGLRQAWGGHIAPIEASTRQWTAVAIAAGILGYLLGRSSRRKKRK